jgi:hypothetical protein
MLDDRVQRLRVPGVEHRLVLTQILAHTKGPPRAGQHHRAHRLVVGEVADRGH